MSACTLWEARKAVMRGKIISFSSNKKKRENSRISHLELRIKSLEVVYSTSKEDHIRNELRKAKLELNEIIDKQTQFLTPDSNIDQFLSNINLPKLQPEQAMALDSPLSIGELHEALKHIGLFWHLHFTKWYYK